MIALILSTTCDPNTGHVTLPLLDKGLQITDVLTKDTVCQLCEKQYDTIIWDVGPEPALRLDYSPNTRCFKVVNTQQPIIDEIEACCLVKKVILYAVDDSLKEWLSSIQGIIHEYHVCIPICSEPSNLVVSNLEWNNDILGATIMLYKKIRRVNIALTRDDPSWKTITKHTLLKLRQIYNDKGIEIFSINSIFFARCENIFQKKESFIYHFKKVIDFAYILGAKNIIYSGGSSRYINCNENNKYVLFKKSNPIFIQNFKYLCDYAANFNIILYIKANQESKGNYLTENEHVEAFLKQMGVENIRAGVKRIPSESLYTYDTFNLLERS